MLNYFQAFDVCPRCGKAITLEGCESHPTRPNMEFRNFRCETCGPVKTVAVLVRASTSSPKIAA
jgi:hypothetical protein